MQLSALRISARLRGREGGLILCFRGCPRSYARGRSPCARHPFRRPCAKVQRPLSLVRYPSCALARGARIASRQGVLMLLLLLL